MRAAKWSVRACQEVQCIVSNPTFRFLFFLLSKNITCSASVTVAEVSFNIHAWSCMNVHMRLCHLCFSCTAWRYPGLLTALMSVCVRRKLLPRIIISSDD